MDPLDGGHQAAVSVVAVSFAALQALLAEAKAELRAESLVGAMEKVAVAAVLLNRTLGDLEAVTNVPWTAIALDPTCGAA